MEIKHEKTEKGHLVELQGRLDALNNSKFEAFFNQLTSQPDLSILVDCEQLHGETAEFSSSERSESANRQVFRYQSIPALRTPTLLRLHNM